MQADGVAHEEGLAMVVRHGDIEIADMAEAIAAELELVRELAEPVFAGIEGALPVMVARRIGIGNDHLADARPVDDRPRPPLVAKGELMQHEALARREADMEAPILP